MTNTPSYKTLEFSSAKFHVTAYQGYCSWAFLLWGSLSYLLSTGFTLPPPPPNQERKKDGVGVDTEILGSNFLFLC